MYVLDTNAVIHALKGMGRVGPRLKSTSPSDLAVTALTAYELHFGTLRAKNPKQRQRDIELLLNVIALLPFDEAAAQTAARIRFELEKRGNKIGPLDTLIAGTVLAHGATLITHDAKEFSRVPGLAVEDWY